MEDPVQRRRSELIGLMREQFDACDEGADVLELKRIVATIKIGLDKAMLSGARRPSPLPTLHTYRLSREPVVFVTGTGAAKTQVDI